MISQQGMHANVPMHDYIYDPCPEASVSTGVLETLVNRTTMHARAEHPRLGAKMSSKSRRCDQGSAVHALTLEGPGAIEWIDADDYRSKEAKALRDVAYSARKIPMLEADRFIVESAASSARESLTQFGAGDVEQTLIWRVNGTWCRARPDWVSADRNLVVDLKTCKNADPATWARASLFPGAYDLQASHVLSGLRHIFGEAERKFIFLCAEIEPPFATSLVSLCAEAVDLADRKRLFAMSRWPKCLSDIDCKGYGEGVYYVEAPAYQMYDFAARESV